jgi:tetratricopeptide (TPR) repeat protein
MTSTTICLHEHGSIASVSTGVGDTHEIISTDKRVTILRDDVLTSDAIQMYQSEIEKDPMNFSLWYSLSETYAAAGCIDSAIEACELGNHQYPTSPSPLMALSNLYAVKGDYVAAISKCKQVFEFKPAIVWLALECEDKFTLPNVKDIEAASSLEK